MMRTILGFELGNSLRRPLVYVHIAIFFAFGFLAMALAAGAIGGVTIKSGGVKANSPFSLCFQVSGLSVLSIVAIASITGQSICADFRHKVHPFVFSTPVSKLQLLVGRFVAANVVQLLVVSSILAGCYVGTVVPTADPDSLTTNRLLAYAQPLVTIAIPNMFVASSIFFAVAAMQRKMMPLYVSVVLILIAQFAAESYVADLDSRFLASLLDPFGTFAFQDLTRYLTVAEKNSQLVRFEGVLVFNRVLWVSIGVIFLVVAFVRFRFSEAELNTSREVHSLTSRTTRELPEPSIRVSQRWLLFELTWFEFRSIVQTFSFPVILLGLVWLLFNAAPYLGAYLGTSVYPVTAIVLGLGQRGVGIFVFGLAAIYAGQLVWREREADMAQLCDAQPVPTWLPLVSKLAALTLMQACVYSVVTLCGVVIQARQGYFNFEWGIYAKALFGIEWIQASLLCVLALFVHVTVNHKYLGHAALLVFYFAPRHLPRLGLDHRLLQYPSHPGYTYSDMNGFGHFMGPILWFYLYWVVLAGLLVVGGTLFHVRGLEGGLATRLRIARHRWSARLRSMFLCQLILLAGIGGFVFYNTSVLNDPHPQATYELQRAAYEKHYKAFESVPQPRITRVEIHADIDPHVRSLRLRGTYQMENKADTSISKVLVQLPVQCDISRLALGSHGSSAESNSQVGVHLYELTSPLAPGDSVQLAFDVSYRQRGFKMNQEPAHVVANGTFFNVGYFPTVGYLPRIELLDRNTRRKYGLSAKDRVPRIDDGPARRNHYISSFADWIEFEATVSTVPDQIAIAPGSLQREWTEGGRRFFHYKSDSQMLHFFAFLSARYEVLRDQWNEVDIEVFYHPGHEYNLKAMVSAAKRTLEYCSENYGPYPNKCLRIVEFPRYSTGAQSFASTIPYSEGAGFIARVDRDDPKNIHYPYYITAHEVAHQWWAHQVVGANVQGASMLSESLCQYVALMVMRKEFGQRQIRRLLRHELDQYLSGRGNNAFETPLALDEARGFVHYNKGSLAMYAVQDYLGEKAVNQVLRQFLQKNAFQDPPYVISTELVELLRGACPADREYIIEDLFETITLYENRAERATCHASGNEFEVQLEVSSRKQRADERGSERQIPLDDLIDIGVFDAGGNLIYLRKHRIDAARKSVTIRVTRRPTQAGIDPTGVLIDRLPDDNVIPIEHISTGS